MASVDERLDKLESQMQKLMAKLEEAAETGEELRDTWKGKLTELQGALTSLAAQMDGLEMEAVTYGAKIGLRMHSEQLMMPLPDGGPTEERKPIGFESRTDPGPWESFTVERGTD